MFQGFFDFIESKRNPKNFLWQPLVFSKDLAWLSIHVPKIIYSSLKKPGPNDIDHVSLGITYLCNSRCNMCNIWKRYIDEPAELAGEISLEDIKKIFSSKYFDKMTNILITGGEPTLRRDFADIVGFFAEKYPGIEMTNPTNAIKPDLIFSKYKEIMEKHNPKNYTLSVSLDGLEETHDKVRGIPGNFNNAIKLINLIKNNLPKINLGFSFTITPANYKDLLKVYDLSKELKIGFGFQFGQISEHYYVNADKKDNFFVWDKEKLSEVNRAIEHIVNDMKLREKKLPLIKRIGSMSEIGYYFSKNVVEKFNNPKRDRDCYSGSHSCYVDPFGEIYPCIMLNRSFGNAKKLGFDAVWMSEEAQKTRELIEARKCSCWTPCETISSLRKDTKLVVRSLAAM